MKIKQIWHQFKQKIVNFIQEKKKLKCAYLREDGSCMFESGEQCNGAQSIMAFCTGRGTKFDASLFDDVEVENE
jgi:hypothetical protein